MPVLEQAAVRTAADAAQLLEALAPAAELAEQAGVRLGIEAVLPADQYRRLIDEAGSRAVCAYYDIGNAAAAGLDPAVAIRMLGTRLGGIHIKDRAHWGPNVALGTGSVDFTAVCRRDCRRALRRPADSRDASRRRPRQLPHQPAPASSDVTSRSRTSDEGAFRRARRVRVLVAGVGSIGQRHIRNLRALFGRDVDILAYRQRKLSRVITEEMTVDTGRSVDDAFGSAHV